MALPKLSTRLEKIQAQLTPKRLSIKELRQLQSDTKKAFDDTINRLMIKRNLFSKIQVPRSYIPLWVHQGKRIELPINWRYLLSAPFIYGMIFPSLIFHLGVEIYHQICFRLYGIPLVDSQEYFVYDRQLLSWLNPWEKINCIYCSYVNNLIRYSAEISGRTERYWCPIKYARRLSGTHSQYSKFISSKDPKKFRKQWEKLRDFSDIPSKN